MSLVTTGSPSVATAADAITPSQRSGHCARLEQMPGDRVRLPVSRALNKGARTDSDQITGPDQRPDAVAAVSAVGQVTGERDTIETGQTKPQQIVHHRSMAR